MRISKQYLFYALCLLCGAGGVQADNLYQEGHFQPLVSDYRASRPGDTLTILIYEDSKASATAGTSTNKSSDSGLGARGSISTGPTWTGSAGWQMSEGFQGNGRIQRTGNLAAQLSVTVQSVAANGDLLVKGEQLIEVNGEKQEIRVEGRVRPQDIGNNNAVISSRLADAKISYIGDGVLANGQHPGFLTRILSWLGLL